MRRSQRSPKDSRRFGLRRIRIVGLGAALRRDRATGAARGSAVRDDVRPQRAPRHARAGARGGVPEPRSRRVGRGARRSGGPGLADQHRRGGPRRPPDRRARGRRGARAPDARRRAHDPHAAAAGRRRRAVVRAGAGARPGSWRAHGGCAGGPDCGYSPDRVRELAEAGVFGDVDVCIDALAGRTAIVTGAARGIGRGIARALRRRGCVRRRDGPGRGRRGAGRRRAVGAGDARALASRRRRRVSRGGCSDLADETLAAFGRIDVLVNNAGIASAAPLVDTASQSGTGCSASTSPASSCARGRWCPR